MRAFAAIFVIAFFYLVLTHGMISPSISSEDMISTAEMPAPADSDSLGASRETLKVNYIKQGGLNHGKHGADHAKHAAAFGPAKQPKVDRTKHIDVHAEQEVEKETTAPALLTRPDDKDANTLRFEAGLRNMLAIAPDEIHIRELLRPIEGTGKEKLRETGVRARAFKNLFTPWEALHVVEENNVTFVRDDVVTYLRQADDLSSITTSRSRADVIRAYERYRHFLTKLSSLLFPWTAPYFADHMTLHAHLRNGGRGIVLSAGDGQLKYIMTSIKTFRKLGCSLPIEIMYLGDDDLEDDSRSELESLPDVVTRDMKQMVDDQGWDIKGWAGKPFAILLSSFREVIFIDADSLFFRNPEVLFHDPDYEKTGALFFRDRLMFPESKKKWLQQILPTPVSENVRKSRFWTGESGHMQESGVVVVDKWRHFMALLMVTRMNGPDRDGDKEKGLIGMYDMVYGDKETFWLGWEIVGDTDYAFHPGNAGNMGVAYADRGDSPKIAHTAAHIGKHKNLGALAGKYDTTVFDPSDARQQQAVEALQDPEEDPDKTPVPEPEPEEEDEEEQEDMGEEEADVETAVDEEYESLMETADDAFSGIIDAAKKKKQPLPATPEYKELEESSDEPSGTVPLRRRGLASRRENAKTGSNAKSQAKGSKPAAAAVKDAKKVAAPPKDAKKAAAGKGTKSAGKEVPKDQSRDHAKDQQAKKVATSPNAKNEQKQAETPDEDQEEELANPTPMGQPVPDTSFIGTNYTVCAPQLLHLDRHGRPLWFNGWILNNKFVDNDHPAVLSNFSVYMQEMREDGPEDAHDALSASSTMTPAKKTKGTPAQWDLQANNMCCLKSDRLHRFTKQEKEVLAMIVETAKEVGAVPR